MFRAAALRDLARNHDSSIDLVATSSETQTPLQEAQLDELARVLDQTGSSIAAEVEPDTEPDFDFPDIGVDDDDLELTAEATTFDDSLTESERVAARLLKVIHENSFPANIGDHNDEVVYIEVIGRLPDGRFAWTADGGRWGTLKSNQFSYWKIQDGDRVRARVTSRPWLHEVEGAVMPTLERRGLGRIQPPALISSRPKTNTFVDELQPGDVVVAHVPFGPNAPVDHEGRTGKHRPVVFVGWSGPYVRVRGVYTFEKGRYITRHGGIQLSGTAGIFNKPNVAVKKTIVELQPANLKRRIGRLHPQDLGRIGLGGVTYVPSSPTTPQNTGLSRASLPQSQVFHVVEPGLRAYALDILSSARSMETGDWSAVIDQILDDFAAGRIPVIDPDKPGLSLVALGSLLKVVEVELVWPARPPKLAGHLSELLSGGRNGLLQVVSNSDAPSDVRLSVGTPTNYEKYSSPIKTMMVDNSDAPADVSSTGVEVSAESWGGYESEEDVPISLVVLDQFWTAEVLGDERLDLLALRVACSGGFEPRSVLIGSGRGNRAAFHHAAEDRGWEVLSCEERSEFLTRLTGVLSSMQPGRAILVSARIDALMEIENLGWEVDMFIDLDQFLC